MLESTLQWSPEGRWHSWVSKEDLNCIESYRYVYELCIVLLHTYQISDGGNTFFSELKNGDTYYFYKMVQQLDKQKLITFRGAFPHCRSGKNETDAGNWITNGHNFICQLGIKSA